MKNRYALLFMAFVLVTVVSGCGKKDEGSKGSQRTGVAGVQAEQVQEAVPAFVSAPITEERTLFSFETGDDGFEIPLWAEDKADNAGRSISLSKSYATDGSQSLSIVTDFPGRIWTSAILELEQYLDLSMYRQIAVDVYVPENTPLGLKAKIILTVGDKWKWTEMVRSVALNPGSWVTIRASIEPGSYDWKRTEVTTEFAADIRKIVIRVESNKRPIYNGPIYIDNVRVGK